MKRKSSFAFRLTLPIVICMVAVFVASIFVVGYFFNGILRMQAVDKSEEALKTSCLYINTSLKEIQTVVENNARLLDQYRSDTSYFSNITSKVLKDNTGIIGSSISLVPDKYDGMKCAVYSCYSKDDSERVVTSSLYTRSYDYTTMDWYQIPLLLGHPVWSENYFDEGGGDQQMTTYSYPMKDENGNIYAIFTADISLSWLTDKAVSIKPYEESRNFVFSRGGKFLTGDSTFTSGETIFSNALEHSDSLLLKIGKRMVSGVRDIEEFDFDDDYVIGVYGPLDNGWSIMIMSPYYVVAAPVFLINAIMTLMLLISILIIVLISVKIIKKHTKHISEFSDIVLNIGQKKFDNVLPEIKYDDEIKTLRDAIEQMQFSMRDMQSATYIQSSMVPPSSLITEFSDLHAILEPAKGIGGDMYDYYYSNRRHKEFFLVGDVAGKGVPAALFMSMVISSIRLMTRYFSDEKDIVTKVNDSISSHNSTQTFVTMLFGSIDIVSRKLVLCNAGHDYPILVDPSGNARYLKLKTNIVGAAFEGFDYETDEFDLEAGSRLIVYTDGVVEAERSDYEQYGTERLLNFVASLPMDMTSEQVTKAVREDVRDFAEYRKYCPEGTPQCHDYPQNDDITIMVIQIK